MKIFAFQTFLILVLANYTFASSWPQWRGPNRNGKAETKISLQSEWSEQGPPLLWQSDEIPSQDYGGFGSVIADEERAYISLVWHRDVPAETRTISDLVLRKMGARKLNLPKELVQKAEADRMSLSPRLRGAKLDEWIQKWIDQNLNHKQKLVLSDLIASRFKKGKLAMPVEVINKLFEVKNKVFANQQSLTDWLNGQGFSEEIKQKVSEAVPPTKQVAEDVVLALDLITGTTSWRTALDSVPTGRKSSSTPCLANGKIFAVGSERIYCLNANTGKPVWDQALPTREIASSILVHKKSVILLAGNLRAYDQENGKLLWENKKVSGKAASPVLWDAGDKKLVICNTGKLVVAVDPKDGNAVWEGPGGGSSTPTTSGTHLLVHAKDEDAGLIAYHWKDDKIEEAWRIPKLTRRTDSSPIIHNGHAYLIGAGMRMCVEMKSGKVIRKIMAKHDISSPILADGKILAYEINGSQLKMIEANPDNFEEIQKTKINALRCTTPALAGTKLLIRKEKGVGCYELGKINSP